MRYRHRDQDSRIDRLSGEPNIFLDTSGGVDVGILDVDLRTLGSYPSNAVSIPLPNEKTGASGDTHG